MVGERGDVLVEVMGVRCEDRPRRSLVGARPVERRQIVIERFTDQRMREAVLARRIRSLLYDASEHRRVQEPEERIRAFLGNPAQHVELERSADDRSDRQHFTRRFG